MFAVPTYITIDGVEPAHRLLLEWASLTLTLPALVYSAAPFFRGAWRDLKLLRPGMDVPVALGLAAAFVASAWATLARRGRRLLRLGDDVHRARCSAHATSSSWRGGRQATRSRSWRARVRRRRCACRGGRIGRTSRPSPPPRWPKAISCWCARVRRFPPTAGSSTDRQASKRPCSPANRGRGRRRRATRCSRVPSCATARSSFA